MKRRIVHPEATAGSRLTLAAADRHHLEHVVRLAPGSEIEVIDGRGGAFRARYLGTDPPEVEVIDAIAPLALSVPVTIALAMIKGPRMDWAVEKLSELGVERLVPVKARRSVVVPRVERWRRIALAAARQCGRAELMAVLEPVGVSEVAALAAPAGSAFVLDPAGPEGSMAENHLAPPVLIAVGPEGGFSAEERDELVRGGLRRLRIVRPVMRAETAAIVAAALAIAALQRSPGE